jgi:hypothetical protein
MCYMPWLSHPPSLAHSNYAWKREHIMKLLIMQFSKLLPFHPSSVQIFFSAPFSNICSLCSSLKIRNQVSDP